MGYHATQIYEVSSYVVDDPKNESILIAAMSIYKVALKKYTASESFSITENSSKKHIFAKNTPYFNN